MRWFFLCAGGVTTVAMLGISMRINFFFGYSLGQTPERAEVFGWVSVISDCWKALGPIFIVVLFREKRQWATAAASAIWAACLLYSVTSAVGAAIEDRSSRTGNREAIVMNYDDFTAEAKRLEERRNGLRAHRPAPIVEAAINALLLRPLEGYRRASTVGEVSANCQHPDQRATEACAEVAQLREELAAAKEEHDLDREIANLKAKVRELRELGAIKASDPQADLLAGITGGWLSPRDVGRALALLLAITIESVSAFGPIVLTSYAEATNGRRAVRRDEKKPAAEGSLEEPAQPLGLVIDFLSERIEPAPQTETLSQRALYADYAAWCHSSDLVALSMGDFVADVDQLRAEKGLAGIRKRKGGYCGIRLVESHETPATGSSGRDAPCRALSPPVATGRDATRPVGAGEP